MQDIKELLKARKVMVEKRDSELKEFERVNPKPKIVYCTKHTEIIVTDFKIVTDGENALRWLPVMVECDKCKEVRVKAEQYTRLMQNANIPARYLNTPADDKYSEIVGNGCGVLFMGGVGTGKTYALVGLIKDLIKKGNVVRFRTFGEICREVRDAVGNNNSTEVYDDYLKYDIFVLDDLGVENSTTFIKEFLYNFVNDMYNNNKILLITTNLTGDEIVSAYTQRVASRLREMCEVVKLEGRDRRVANAKGGKLSETSQND